MILNKIALLNYGPFCGENVINFAKQSKSIVENNRNIILIGGKNGSGKTSLFTAIQICLYGQAALGTKASKRAYDVFLREQIHKANSLIPITMASIEIDFDFSVCGHRDNYKAKRTWQIKAGNELDENLAILKNDEPLENFEEKSWQDFVNYLIPQGLLKLFFFDGERINALTKDDNNLELAESIQALFGIDIVKQLKADLRYFERKKLANGKSSDLEKRLSDVEDRIQKCNIALDTCKEKIANILSQIDVKNNSVRRAESKLRASGTILGSSRDALNEQITTLSIEIEEKEKNIRNYFQQALPFYYAREYLTRTLGRIDGETAIRELLSYKKEFNKIWKMSKSGIKKLIKSKGDLKRLYELLVPRFKGDRHILVHDNLSDIDVLEIKQWFLSNAKEQRKQVVSIAKDIEKSQRELSKLRGRLEYVPEGDQVAEIIGEVNKLSKEKGELDGLLKHQELQESELKNELADLEREKGKIENEIGELASSDRRLNLVDKSIRVLQGFEQELINKKIKTLENNVLSCFINLLRKGDVVNSIKIDKDSFDVSLEDKLGRKIDKKKLSEGEKQIYAVSLLSGITRTTQRVFPVFMDTPLGRLDSNHRMNIIHRYFPKASHQLVVLSTDTEIDREYFKELKPYLNYSYLLDFDEQEKRTVVKEGYFWK